MKKRDYLSLSINVVGLFCALFIAFETRAWQLHREDDFLAVGVLLAVVFNLLRRRS